MRIDVRYHQHDRKNSPDIWTLQIIYIEIVIPSLLMNRAFLTRIRVTRI